MLKNIVPSLLLAGAVLAPAAAADASAAGPYVGFEFGFNFNLYNDDRLDGAATTFALTFPVSSNFSASVVHERGNITGKNDGNQADIDTEANEIRATYQVWGSDTQAVKLFLGFGNIQYTGDLNDSALLGDLGAQYVPVKSKTGPVTGQLDIHANYRYAKITPDNVGLGDDLDDMGGFQIGLGVGLFF
jgi:hypothetical protein